MHLFYRISDQSYVKPKVEGATKETCLKNFCIAFQDIIFSNMSNVPPMSIMADRCVQKTVEMLLETGIPLSATDLGNAGSLRKTLELAMDLPDDEVIYFCEDDYIHAVSPSPSVLLQEGLQRADYVTLYDHPDKYTRVYNGGEFSKVIRTKSSHWRYTKSTCMTFGVKCKTLKSDKAIWWKHTESHHPFDHHIFTELGEKKRRLAVCIPGAACHMDLTFSNQMQENLIEAWTLQYLPKQ